LPWLLDQFRKNEQTTGKRLLDVLTVHYYPQSGEYSTDLSAETKQNRNRSTRSLWDPSYVDTSWIADNIHLIPRLKQWVAESYPGTAIGITEYSWGADGYMNGATAQADILGIFGREGLDLANRWISPINGTPTFNAIKLYRNYDNAKSTFGDVSLLATTPNPDNQSAFAAERTLDGALTIMVVNKIEAATPVSLQVSNFAHNGKAQLWLVQAGAAITRYPDFTVQNNAIATVLPGESIGLFVLPAESSGPQLRAGSYSPSDGMFKFLLNGLPGKTYAIYSSNDLKDWRLLQNTTLTLASMEISVPANGENHKFLKAVLVP
jgi:hypothetical protein